MPSLSACGLPTPFVALACICDGDIRVFSGAGVSILPPLKGEGDQRSWWRGSAEIFCSCFRFHRRNPSVKPAACQLPFQGSLFCLVNFHQQNSPPAGRTGGLSAVTLPFSLLKLGRRVSGDSPLSLLKRKKEAKKEKSSRSTCTTKSSITRRLHERLRTRAIYSHRFSPTKLPRRGIQAACPP